MNFIRSKHRIVAVLLCLILVCTCFLGMDSFTVDSQAAGNSVSRADDPSTMGDWTENFGSTVTDTSGVGRIWTDKTVSDENVILYSENGEETLPVNRSDENNFLVGLSAISSNKEIFGQENLPIDVMLVLDVSASMGEESGSDSCETMVKSANAAIDRLFELNPNNRVGVVLYSGSETTNESSRTSTATVLLDLKRYTSNNAQYLSYHKEREWRNREWVTVETIEVADNVYEEGSSWPVRGDSKEVIGGTYIQNGVYQAMQQFLGITDTDVNGVERIPVMVLMSDGAPTTSTTSYTNVGNSNMGSGTTSSAASAFVTQLTNAYARAQMKEHYGREPLFYTLGLGLSALEDDDLAGGVTALDKSWALSVMDPSQSTGDLQRYWKTFQGLSTSGRNSTMTIRDIEYYSTWGEWRYQYTNETLQRRESIITDIDYVDEYFPAENSDGLTNAFNAIVREIEIQSKYYPTNNGSGSPNLSGYVTFEDEIGEYMRVKNVNGLVFHGRLYNGSNFAKTITNSAYWIDGTLNMDIPTIREFVQSIIERLGVSQEQAIDLITTAVDQGDIYYNRWTGEFGHQLVWYGDSEGNYVEPFVNDPDQQPDSRAATLNHSYMYLGNSTDTATGADMMYISARLITDIATGNQTMRLAVPSALVPMVQYTFTIDDTDLAQADQVTEMSRTEAYPMRFFYEVGLEDGLNEDTVQWMVDDSYEYLQADGTYRFYTNAWDSANQTAKTTVQFSPSIDNEFYFYALNTPILDARGNPVRWIQSGETYYYYEHIFDAQNQTSQIRHELKEIQPEALEHRERSSDGTWYIPRGTSKYTQDDYSKGKTDNQTETSGNSLTADLTTIPGKDGQDDQIRVTVALGNNGRIELTQTTGDLSIEKVVSGNHGDSGKDFTFTVNLKENDGITSLAGEYAYTVNRQDGSLDTGNISDGGTIQLKGGETITIMDIPTGAKFTVTEQQLSEYETSNTVDGTMSENGLIAAGEIHSSNSNPEPIKVVFTNHWDVPYTSFSFTKVDGKNTDQPLEGATFQLYRLNCTDTDEHNHENDLVNTENPGEWELVNQVTTEADGKVNFDQLTENTTYRLVETVAPDGFAKPSGQWVLTVDLDADPQVTIGEVENPPAFMTDKESGELSLPNNRPMDPPITGGGGQYWPMILAGAVMMAGSISIFWFKKRRERFLNK